MALARTKLVTTVVIVAVSASISGCDPGVPGPFIENGCDTDVFVNMLGGPTEDSALANREIGSPRLAPGEVVDIGPAVGTGQFYIWVSATGSQWSTASVLSESEAKGGAIVVLTGDMCPTDAAELSSSPSPLASPSAAS